ncbi:MAG: hypothetical protein E6R03_00675 [Hyphomicrobiaceae bacterium]|nr:MAG: hypothetical protein E6R03_00675 [Hyphomicrobiaceae bacterium]
MATYNKFNLFTRDLIQKKHDFANDTFKVLLTNTAPVATNAVKADLTEISAGNGYTAGGTATSLTLSNASGVEKVVAANVTFTASGGTIGPFRYAVWYNDTQTSPADPLIGWADYGSSITLNSTETFTWTPDATNGLFTLT